MTDRKVSVFRREHFNAAHRLNNPAWSDEKNREIFGKCNNPSFHGHNYELEIKVTGVPDNESGYVIDLKLLADLVENAVLAKFDHKNLNLDVPEFKQVNPTVENISLVIYDLLRKELNPDLDLKVRVYETPRNYAEYPAG